MLLILIRPPPRAPLLPIVVGQVRITRTAMHRVRALDSAQAGLDVALGNIREAHDAAGNGVAGKLPCGPFDGRVDAANDARYHVTLDYLLTDPRGQSDSWV